MKNAVLISAVLGVAGAVAQAAPPGWDAYAIRGTPVINEAVPGQTQFIVNDPSAGNEKAGLGTSGLDGSKVGSIAVLQIARLDDYTRFPTNNGAYYAPYMNIWIKDAAGKYAVLANEPSNAEWTGTSEWNTSGAKLMTKTMKLFEVEPGFALPDPAMVRNPANGIVTLGPDQVTFAAFADYVIEAPSVAKLAAGWVGLGGGAPREFGTNVAYGFNWIFGDTGGNYTGDAIGYIVGDTVAATPTPAAAVGAVPLLGLLAARRGRRQA